MVSRLLEGLRRRLVYAPDTRRPDPAACGVPGAAVGNAATADGLALLTWYVPPATADGPQLLYLHGNGGHIGYRAGRMRRMAALGWGVLLLEYRGYGGNPGVPSEAGLWLDTQAGLDLLQRTGAPPDRTLVWGESLGTGLAVRLAAEAPIAILLLESPYSCLSDVARWHAPLLPGGALLRGAYDAASRIARVRCPTLVMIGEADRVIPPALGRAMHDAITAPKQLWIAPHAGHNDLAEAGAVEAAAAFVDRHLPRRAQ